MSPARDERRPMTALRWLQERWLSVLIGALLSTITYELLIRATPLQPATAVGFMLCAVLGCCLVIAWWTEAGRGDDHEQRLSNLEVIVAGWLPEEPEGWPEEEPNPVEPPTDEIPVVLPETVPIGRAWDESAAELVDPEPAPELRTVERVVNGFTFRVREEAA